MIRINLLKPGRAPGATLIPAPEAARSQPPKVAGNHWISRGEVLTGVALLAMGLAVLAYLISLPKAPPTESEPAGPKPAVSKPSGSKAPAVVPAAAARAERAPPATASASPPEPVSGRPPAAAAATLEPQRVVAHKSAVTTSIPASKPPPGASGFQVTGISIRRQPGSVLVAVEVGPGVKYRAMELRSPSRLVLDIANCNLVMPAPLHTQAVNSPHIQRVRASQYQREPAVCRIVLDATSLPRYEVRPAANGLEIQIADSSQ